MPMRTLDGVDDVIVFALGSLGFAFGPGTLAAIVSKDDDSGIQSLVYVGISATSGRYALKFSGTALQLQCGSSAVSAPTITVTAAEGLVFVAATKATGNVAPRFHKYNFATEVWTHENAGSNLGNSGTPTNSARLGATNTLSQFFVGDAAIAGVSDTVLSDSTLETLITAIEAWSTAGLVALWPLNQASTATPVEDTIGTADETSITGTTVTAGDVPWTSLSGTSDTATMGVAIASGVAPNARTSVTPGQAVASATGPATRTTVPLGTATATGTTPTTTAAEPVTPGSATASGATPSSSTSETNTLGLAVTFGIEPSDEAVETTPTLGVATTAGISPSPAVTVTGGTASAAGIDAGAAVTASTGVAATTGINPSTTLGVVTGVAVAVGIGPSARALLTTGISVGQGVSLSSALSESATTGIAVAFGIEPTITRPAIRLRLTTSVRPSETLTTGVRDVQPLTLGTRPIRTLEAE